MPLYPPSGGGSSGLISFQGRTTAAAVLEKTDVTGTGLTYSDVGADASGAAAAAQMAAEAASLASTSTLNAIAAANATAADWSNNSHKITSLANGTAAQDAAAFGQVPTNTTFVDLTTAQSVAGQKTFDDGIVAAKSGTSQLFLTDSAGAGIYSGGGYIQLSGDTPSSSSSGLYLFQSTGVSKFYNTQSTGDITQFQNSSGVVAGVNHGGSVYAKGYTSAIVSEAASYALTSADSTVIFTATATATLPTAVGITGRQYTIKVGAASTTVTVATTSSQTIDGAASLSLATQNEAVTVQSDGANWWVIGQVATTIL